MSLHQCPRCTWECFEKLRTHSYCINCNYYEVKQAKLPKVSPQPPLPSKPNLAKVLELTVFDNEELITDFSFESQPKKKIA